MKVSDEEVIFLTGGDPTKDENNMRMFHPRCKLMLVTEGGEGCRYYTPVVHVSQRRLYFHTEYSVVRTRDLVLSW